MTVMLHDVDNEIAAAGYAPSTTRLHNALAIGQPRPLPLNDLEYADDTILIATLLAHAQEMIHLIQHRSLEDNMTLNTSKSEHVRVRGGGVLTDIAGAQIPTPSSTTYLGSGLSVDTVRTNRSRAETSRRLGMAQNAFDNLQQVWRHSDIPKRRKKVIYRACVLTKLAYGLQSLVLSQSDKDRIDAFHARCLRKIWNIPSTFATKRILMNAPVTRNAEVLRLARDYPASVDIENQQIKHHAHIYRRPFSDPIRLVTFDKGNPSAPPRWAGQRKAGSPPKSWVTETAKLATEAYRCSHLHAPPPSAIQFRAFLRDAPAVAKAIAARKWLHVEATQHRTNVQDIIQKTVQRTTALQNPDTDGSHFCHHEYPDWGPAHLMDRPPTPWWPDLSQLTRTVPLAAPAPTQHTHLYYTDGSATSKKVHTPPPAGWGVVYFTDAHLKYEAGGRVLVDTTHPDWMGARAHTNNTAELTAMCQALRHALRKHPTEPCEIRYDSKLAAGLAVAAIQPTTNLELVNTLQHLVTQYATLTPITFTHI